MPDQRCSTCTATTCRRAEAGRRSPGSCACWEPWTSRHRPSAPPSPGWCGEGWLEPVEQQGQRGYAATARARARLAEARSRIYRTADQHWDGTWHVVVVEHAADRASRGRTAAAMGYLGYARLAPDTWIAPRASAELAQSLAAEGLGSRQFLSRYTEPGARRWRPTCGTSRAWRRRTGSSSSGPQELTAGLEADLTPERGFAVRSLLVHEWRKFLFRDPGLPAEVLPPDWPGRQAAKCFDTTAASLLPLARAFVDSCLATDLKTRS